MPHPDRNQPYPRPFRLFGLLLLAASASPAAAGQGLERLHTFYRETRSFQADFRQKVLGSRGEIQERSSGRVWIQRPDRFRWDYRQPYRQLIVADGTTVKFFDPEMEQVTVRSYAGGMGHTPSRVLAGSGDLERHFRVEESARNGPLAWVTLTPREPEEAGFQQARVGLAADPVRVERFEFSDAFGNQTEIRFEDIRLNPDMPDDRFQFEPPAGTDVLGSGAEPN